MKYREALKEKNVKKEDLSKKLQSKIDALLKLEEKLEISDEDDKDDIKLVIEEMDLEISKSIKKFNPEVHQRRLESIASLNDKRNSGEVNKGKRPAAIVVKKEVEKQPIIEEQPKETLPEPEERLVKAKSKSLEKNLDELRQKAYEAYNLSQEQPNQVHQVQQDPEELQDFQPTRKVRSRGQKFSFGLMAVGVLFFGWGVVNLMKSK